jgi:hypothetical protein
MNPIKRYKALIAIALILAAGIFYFFYHFFDNDVKALTDFSAAYDKFDKAISGFSNAVLASNPAGEAVTDDLERKAGEALIELNTKANARISSLTKNDAELMKLTLEIGDISGKELDALSAYKKPIADQNSDLTRLAKELGDLTSKRQTDYVRFKEILGLNN